LRIYNEKRVVLLILLIHFWCSFNFLFAFFPFYCQRIFWAYHRKELKPFPLIFSKCIKIHSSSRIFKVYLQKTLSLRIFLQNFLQSKNIQSLSFELRAQKHHLLSNQRWIPYKFVFSLQSIGNLYATNLPSPLHQRPNKSCSFPSHIKFSKTNYTIKYALIFIFPSPFLSLFPFHGDGRLLQKYSLPAKINGQWRRTHKSGRGLWKYWLTFGSNWRQIRKKRIVG